MSTGLWSSLWGWPGRRRTGHEGEEEGKPNEPKKRKRNPNAVPQAEPEDDCVDCFRWYVQSSCVHLWVKYLISGTVL